MNQEIATIPTPEEAANALEKARLKAAIGYEYLVETLTLRGFDPAIQTKDALAIAEHMYKASGMAAKQTAVATMPSVKFTFNAGSPLTSTQNTVEIDITPQDDPLSTIPGYIASMPPLGTPADLVIFDENE